jgi:hypothetical protein
VLYHLSHISSPFCFSYFGDRVLWLFPAQLGLRSSYVCFLQSWDGRHLLPNPAIGWVGDFTNCCPSWPWTIIAASQVAGISRCKCPCLHFNISEVRRNLKFTRQSQLLSVRSSWELWSDPGKIPNYKYSSWRKGQYCIENHSHQRLWVKTD